MLVFVGVALTLDRLIVGLLVNLATSVIRQVCIICEEFFTWRFTKKSKWFDLILNGCDPVEKSKYKF
jgi:hypothetical protein